MKIFLRHPQTGRDAFHRVPLLLSGPTRRAAKRDQGRSGIRPYQDRAFVLVAVLVVVMLASMIVVSLLFRLHAEETAVVAGAGSEQAWAAAMSGVSEAMRIAAQSAPGMPDWEDNPEAFRERLVFDDGSDRWYFTVYSMGDPDLAEVRFGLTDEAAKLNVNKATEEMLEKLPGMTPYLTQGLLDFLDKDNTPRPEGAEQEYYDALPKPYAVFNGPLSTLEEILLVRGFTPALLFGEDANSNFQLDPNEDDAEAQFPPDNHDGKLDCGLRQYLTVSSYDLNETSDRQARIDLNDPADSLKPEEQPDLPDLPDSLVAYIEALRRGKVKLAHPVELLEAKAKLKDENGKEAEMDSGVGKAELPLVLDLFTTTSEGRLPALINVNTASARVLQTLPGVDEALAESLVSSRRNLRPEQRRTPAWLYQEGLMDASQLKKIAPYITARSLQFRFQVVGFGVPSSRYRVLDVIIDLAGTTPVVTYLRDITRLGLPFRIELPAGDSIAPPPSQPMVRAEPLSGTSSHTSSPTSSPTSSHTLSETVSNHGKLDQVSDQVFDRLSDPVSNEAQPANRSRSFAFRVRAFPFLSHG